MSAEEEPAPKKAKTEEETGWENHTMNVSEALMKGDEGKFFGEIKDMHISTLQGIGEKSSEVIEHLGVKTVGDMASYKFFHIARAIKTLAETETAGGRLEGSTMNIDNALDKEWESKTLKEIVEAPIEILQGISKGGSDLLSSLGLKTVGDLADSKFCKMAESIVTLSKYEENKTASERKAEATLKKLS